VVEGRRPGLWADRLIQGLSSVWQVQVGLREERFVRHPVLGRLDSAENILANKLTALFDRQEPKDMADLLRPSRS